MAQVLRKLLHSSNISAPLVWWEKVFGRDFPAVHQFLSAQIGVPTTTYPCPVDSAVSLAVRESGDGYRAFPTDEWADDFDDLQLEWSDVQAWKLDCAALSNELRAAFQLKESGAVDLGGLFHVGKCSRNKQTRQVYLCLESNDRQVAEAVASVPTNHSIGCILIGEHSVATDAILQGKGIGCTPLCETLSYANGAWVADCPQSCLACKAVSNEDLSEQMRDGFDSVLRERVEDIIDNRAKQHTIEELADGADKFLAGMRTQLNEKEFDLFLLMVRKESDANGQLQPLTFAEVGKHLGVSKQAAHSRYKKLAEQHPQVASFIEAEREKQGVVPFSGMSPSDRRSMGVDESYNYDKS